MPIYHDKPTPSQFVRIGHRLIARSHIRDVLLSWYEPIDCMLRIVVTSVNTGDSSIEIALSLPAHTATLCLEDVHRCFWQQLNGCEGFIDPTTWKAAAPAAASS